MIARILAELGPWNWMVLGFVLLALEILLPGVFLVWVGIAAILTGAFLLQFGDAPFWTWHWQTLLFLALTLVSVLTGRRLLAASSGDSDQPLLNRRAEQLVGRTAVLVEPIREGRGRIQLGDTLWLVSGPDLSAGTRVRVTHVAGSDLVVAEAP